MIHEKLKTEYIQQITTVEILSVNFSVEEVFQAHLK